MLHSLKDRNPRDVPSPVREKDLWMHEENTIDGLTEGQMADLIAEIEMNSTDPDTERRVVDDLRARVAPTAAVLRAGAWPTCPAALVP